MHKFCDRRFMAYFCSTLGVQWFTPKSWLYFYSRAGGIMRVQPGEYKGGASCGVEVTDVDYQVATKHAKPELRSLPQEEIVFLAAKLRHCLEEIIVSWLGVESGIITSIELRRHCDKAVEIHCKDSCLDSITRSLAWDVGC